MALKNMNEMLSKAREGKYAVGNFDVFNIEMLMGVMRAAEELKSPVIIAYAQALEGITRIEDFSRFIIKVAEDSAVDVALHLDHADSFDYIKRAIDSGFTSVMLDASDLTLVNNIIETKKVVEMCRPHGISVESELGHVGGLKGMHGACDDYESDCYTDVSEAVKFVKETGVDALAVAIGTVHGVYKSEPRLNFERLAELKAAVKTPLVLHGGSGLSDDDFKKVIALGISKVNIHTDLTIAAKESFDGAKSYIEICADALDAVKRETMKKIELFGSKGRN